MAGILAAGLMAGCGGGAIEPRGAEVIQKYNLSVTSPPTVAALTVPQTLTDPEWTAIDSACRQAGYDVTPYRGQNLGVTQYSIQQMYYPNLVIYDTSPNGELQPVQGPPIPLTLKVLSAGETTVCGYLVAEENMSSLTLLHLGVWTWFDVAVNDSHVR